MIAEYDERFGAQRNGGGHFGALTSAKVEKTFAELNPDWSIDNAVIGTVVRHGRIWQNYGYTVTDRFTGNRFTGKSPRKALEAAGAFWAIHYATKNL